MNATSYEYTVECRGATTNPCYYEIQMIEAACPLWRRSDDLSDCTEFAMLRFGKRAHAADDPRGDLAGSRAVGDHQRMTQERDN